METPQDRLWSKFHHLWSKAVGTPDYIKAEWRDLEAALLPQPAPQEKHDDHDCRDWNSGGVCGVCRRSLSVEEQQRGEPLAPSPQPAERPQQEIAEWDGGSVWPDGFAHWWICQKCRTAYKSPTTGKPPAHCSCFDQHAVNAVVTQASAREPDVQRLVAQALAIEQILRDAGIGSCSLTEGVRQLIARLDAAPQWQPIETAPKGQRVLVMLKQRPLETDGEITFAYFVRPPLTDEPNGIWTRDETGESCMPTHWIPFPHPWAALASSPVEPLNTDEPFIAREDQPAYLHCDRCEMGESLHTHWRSVEGSGLSVLCDRCRRAKE